MLKSYRSILFIKGGILILALTSTPTEQSIANNKRFPSGCRKVNFSFIHNTVEFNYDPTVKTQPQTLYLVHNISHNDIKLEVPRPQKYMPTYTKHIPYDTWAALAKDESPLTLACHSEGGYYSGYDEDCAQVVEICNYNNAKFPPQNIGTYWLDRVGTQQFIKYYAIHKGILLRW